MQGATKRLTYPRALAPAGAAYQFMQEVWIYAPPLISYIMQESGNYMHEQRNTTPWVTGFLVLQDSLRRYHADNKETHTHKRRGYYLRRSPQRYKQDQLSRTSRVRKKLQD